MKYSSSTGLFFILYAFFLTGCVGIDDLSHENYRRGVLYADGLSKETVAVLPMVGRGGNREYVKSAESIFYKALTEMRHQMHLISPQEGLAKMKESDLDSFFRRFEEESFNKVPEETDLTRLRKVFGTRFLLQTELQRVEVTEGATQVRIRGRLWDIEMGDIIWEGTGESRGYLFLFFPRVPASFEKAMEVASRGLIRKFP